METKSFRNSQARSAVTRSRARLKQIGTAKTRPATGKPNDQPTSDRHPELIAWIKHQALHYKHLPRRLGHPGTSWNRSPRCRAKVSEVIRDGTALQAIARPVTL